MLLTKKDLVLLFLQKKKFKNNSIYHGLKNFQIISTKVSLNNCNIKRILKLNLGYSFKIKVKTHHLNTLDSLAAVILEVLTVLFKKSQIKIDYLPVSQQNITVLRSPFVYKTSREQFTKKDYTMLLHLDCDTYSPMYLDYFINILLVKLTNFLLSKIEIIEVLIKK
jgi:ribosomal protein S10